MECIHGKSSLLSTFFFQLLVFVFCIAACIAQDYDEYRPEPRSYNAPNRYVQFEQEAKATTTTAAPVAILKQINRHNDGMYVCLRQLLL